MTEQAQTSTATSDTLLMEIRSLADIYATGTHAENVLQRIRNTLDRHTPNTDQTAQPHAEEDRLHRAIEAVLDADIRRTEEIPLELDDAIDTLRRCRHGLHPLIGDDPSISASSTSERSQA